MASEKKAQLELELQQKRHISNFQQTYIAFVDTLVDTYSNIPELNEWKQEVHTMSAELFHPIAKNWVNELGPIREDLVQQRENIFLNNLPCLVKIYVPQLWVQDKFTSNSKKHVWSYLQVLVQQAFKAFPTSVKKDIQPPNIPNIQDTLPPGIGELYNQLPQSMIDKVRGVADKYSNRVESGETNLEDLKFNEISQELFQSIDPKEMQQVVQSIGGMLQGVMSGVNQDDFRQFLQKK